MNHETVNTKDVFGQQSPLEKVVGFDIAESTYDLLTFREQLVIDLLICGFSQSDIAKIFEVSQPSISSSVRRIRMKLADGKLHLILEARMDFKYGTHNNIQQ